MNTSRRITLVAVATALALSALCAPTQAGVKSASSPRLKLLWAQEFKSTSRLAPSPSTWEYDIGNGDFGWGNNEQEFYTFDNARTDGGCTAKKVRGKQVKDSLGNPVYTCPAGKGNLVITAKKIPDGDFIKDACSRCTFYSARINTKGHYGFKYGRMEARIWMPKGAGTWPAFWLLGANIDAKAWPACGEIDIVEQGDDKYAAQGTIHGPGYSGADGLTGSTYRDTPLTSGFHTYAIDWTPTKITWYLDGKPYSTQTKSEVQAMGHTWVYDHEFFLILNLAMGGWFTNGIDPALTQATMKVDYIRYYSVNGVGTLIKH